MTIYVSFDYLAEDLSIFVLRDPLIISIFTFFGIIMYISTFWVICDYMPRVAYE